MHFVRLTIFSIAAAGLAGCATAPTSPPPSTTSPGTAPATSYSGFAKNLLLCDGDHIDNAPATDQKKRIIGYEPLASVSGVLLARAPVRGCLSSGFGVRHDRIGRHSGIDLSTRHPHPIYAAGAGVVEEMRTSGGYGKMILIRHNADVKTRYAHLSSYASGMHVGHKVQQGDIIGRTGHTGNATGVILHYEIIIGGAPRNPLTVGR